MDLNPQILREYDIRGVYGETLLDQDAYALGQRFGMRVRESGGRTLVVGYDGRLSSTTLHHHLLAGLVSVGIHVRDVGLCPTPAVYFAVMNTGADGGIMITGSHNPPNHNGFKMMLGVKPFYGQMIQDLMKAMPEADAGGEVTTLPILSSYIDRLLQDYAGNKPLKVVWDAGNGATGEVIDILTHRLPGDHILLHTQIDGTFPNRPSDPTQPENLWILQDTIRREGADVGLAFDGDGDRLVALDGQGRMLCGDQLLLILARDVLKTHPGAAIMGDIKSSQILFDGIAAAGGQPVMVRTGHSNIKALMPQLKSPLAGEMSGHIFFADHYFGFDDGLYAAVRLLSLLAQASESLEKMFDDLPKMHNTPELKFPCDDRFAVMNRLQERLRRQGIVFNDTDGVRVTTPDGWWLVRASNTEEILVARCESPTVAGLEALRQELAAVMATEM